MKKFKQFCTILYRSWKIWFGLIVPIALSPLLLDFEQKVLSCFILLLFVPLWFDWMRKKKLILFFFFALQWCQGETMCICSTIDDLLLDVRTYQSLHHSLDSGCIVSASRCCNVCWFFWSSSSQNLHMSQLYPPIFFSIVFFSIPNSIWFDLAIETNRLKSARNKHVRTIWKQRIWCFLVD